MIHRHRVVGVVALTALSSLGITSACGVDGGVEGASTSGASGSAGTSGTSGSAGTSGTSGSAGTSGSTTSGDAAPKTDVKELWPSADLRSLAVGGGKLVFAQSDGLQWCEAPECPARTQASNAPGPAPTSVTFGGAKFHATFDTQLRTCEVKPDAVDCNGGDTATDVLFSGATRLRFDETSFVWTVGSTVKWFAVGEAIQDVAGGAGHDGIALADNQLFFTSTGAAGKALKIGDFKATAMAGNGPNNKVVLASNLVEPNDIAVGGEDVFFAVSGNAGLANGYVQRCKVSAGSGSSCPKVVEGLAGPRAIAVDATDVYVSETGKNRVLRVPRDGTPLAIIAIDLVSPTDIVLDGAYAYVIAIDATAKRRAYRVKKRP